ncbi:MAG: hypothetical protein A2172_01205 [Candidatus Woykebacteria bacterium RBG_13_40_15]|uniref:N-terminal of MaoC-like dehydratase domain-containing protein n=1 Tax=Candidatus Woykebacteria bacterium RBG_13_40_15 TaxID=1802593 RepID=A0A1G1W901_9BACT|nr:MAG: hypothetical protein A2172_01205 [Candidatus Woykebacteria bacterium RBG_13_40_15]
MLGALLEGGTDLAGINVAQLTKGYKFPPITFAVSAEQAEAYRKVTEGVEGSSYIPPLGAIAFALQSLLEQVELPEGSVHGGEGYECHSPIAVGSELIANGSVVDRADRGSFALLEVEIQLTVAGSLEPALVSGATLVTPLLKGGY